MNNLNDKYISILTNNYSEYNGIPHFEGEFIL